jgi:prevent-host-death family protein
MVMIMTMMVNIYEIKAKLSEYIAAVERGERVLICKRNRPVAELRPIAQAERKPRDLTPSHPDWKISPEFFEPLPPEELAAWYGDEPAGRADRVVERAPRYGHSKRKRTRG